MQWYLNCLANFINVQENLPLLAHASTEHSRASVYTFSERFQCKTNEYLSKTSIIFIVTKWAAIAMK